MMQRGFEARFGRTPRVFVRAPGRVDLMGSHTDYNDGFVLTLSIDRDTWIAASPRDDGRIRVESLNVEGGTEFGIGTTAAHEGPDWTRYVAAVARVLHQEGLPLRGCDALVHGTVPIASGLSSSASLEAATATLLAQLGGFDLAPLRMARLCQRAENVFVGVQCGILDQYSSILGEAGSALLLDCRTLTHTNVTIPDGLRVVIGNTMARRQLTDSAYRDRRESCEAGMRAMAARADGVRALRDVELDLFIRHETDLDPVVARRCRFVIEENDRVHALARALEHDDRETIARACEASFTGARDLFEITIPEMESMHHALTRAPGVVGARQAGAGFGGCLVALVEEGLVDAFVASATEEFTRITGTIPEISAVASSSGAGPLRGG